MWHPHPVTPLKTYNATANFFLHENITHNKLKSWDMRFYWLRNKQQNQNFDIYWDAGHNNLADYYIKHHTSQHHKDTRKTYVQDKLNFMRSQYVNCMLSRMLQGCVGTIPPVHHTTTQSRQDTDDVEVSKNTGHPSSWRHADDIVRPNNVQNYAVSHK